MDWKIVPFENGHVREGFDCGVSALNDYLLRQAGQDVRRNYAALFVAVESVANRVVGYYTLSNTGIGLTLIPEALRSRLPKYADVPAIRLGRLAVDLTVRGRGLGAELLGDAVVRSVLNASAWAMMVVKAKDDAARDFYLKFGFEALLDDNRHLYISRRDLEQYFQT